MKENLTSLLDISPVIGAISTYDDLKKIILTDINVVFILSSNILEISNMVDILKKNNKFVFIHIDLIEGLSSRSILSIDYLIKNTKLDGIISTKHNMIKYAKTKNLVTIQRFFILDSLSLNNSLKGAKESCPDAIEILPGLMPKIIKEIKNSIKIPVIAGGLIKDKSDVISALEAGAYGVSSTSKDVWNM
ncbi:MAG: glycerol-3-phosphate responsive antiterminator [Fusobacteriaceae bacterium]|nr:glycerol-3-phosphate responsive antiterminator [Fusobacteriaceae bacterium]MBN2838880.1 glycerol-3-phosphate responsive antiterminator [Fusobacteriaceae bacterium]